LKRLVAISKQQHGPEHSTTRYVEFTLIVCKTQFVPLRSTDLLFDAIGHEDDNYSFEVIGYEDDQYVLEGPIEVAEERMQTLRVDPTDFILRSEGLP
jgi:hypothetical protein